MSLGRVAVTVLVLTGGLSVGPVASAAEVAQDPALAAGPAVAAGEPAAAAEQDSEDPCAPAEDPTRETLEDVTVATAAAAREDDASPPVAHCSGAGDTQYKDPFANAKPPKGGDPAPSQGSQSPDTPTSAPAPTSAQGTVDPAVPGTPGAESAGPGLPNTGLDAGIPAWTGLGLLLAGALLRRRIA